MIFILMAILMPWFLGLLVISVVLAHDEKTGFLERICLAYPLGSGLVTFQLFFLGLFRFPLTLSYILPLITAELIAALLWLVKHKVPVMPKLSPGLIKEIASRETPLVRSVALVLLSAWGGIKIASVIVETYLRPIYAWDSWAHWSVAAKLFYYAHNFMLDVPTAEFFGRGVAARYASNPLHNPLSQVWFSLWTGSFDEVLVKLWSPIYLLCAAIYLYCISSRELNRLLALAMMILFMSSPLMSYHAVEVYSDFPLGVFIFFAVSSFLNAMRGNSGFWPLMGIFSAEALFTKNEAPGMIGPLLVSAGIYIWMNRSRIHVGRTLSFLTAPFLLIAPWFIFKRFYALSFIHDDQKLSILYQPGVVSQFLYETMTLQNFNIFLVLLPVLMLIIFPLTREIRHIFIPLAVYAAFFVMIYSFMPGYYVWAFNGVQFYRNTLTFYPTICFITTLSISLILKRDSSV